VKVERFFEKFELLADTPNTVDNLRKLILRQAVRGSLSSRHATDEPVCDLRSALKVKRARLSTSDRNRSAGEASGPNRGSLPFATPGHWAWIPLYELGELSGGMTPSMSKSAYWGGSVNWFSPKDFRFDRLQSSELKVTSLALHDTALQLYQPGSVLMVARSGILRRTFPVAINEVPATVNQDIKVLSPFVDGMERYLQLMFRGMTDIILFSLVKTGTTVQSLKYDEFSIQPFPIPPLTEQKRIVAKVDELMALCDRLEAQQQERKTRHTALASASLTRFSAEATPANLEFLFHRAYDIEPRGLRQAVLALAIRGRLELQSKNDEPVDDLLCRIQRKRRSLVATKKASNASDVHPVEAEERPFEVPGAWRWLRFGAVSICRDGQRIPVSKDERAGRQGPYDYYGASGVIDKIDGYLFDEPLLLIGEDGANLLNRSTPIAFLADGKYWVNNHAHVLDSDSVDVLRYLALVFNAIDLTPFVTGTAQPKMNQAKMNSIPIPVPPVEEQRRIVAKVDQLLALIDELEARLIASRANGEKLLEAVVAELSQATRVA